MSQVLSRRRLILAAILTAGLQSAVLGQMIATSTGILASGTEVRLKTVPVDPRDLLRGDYVTLAYEFTALDSSLVAGPWPTEDGMQTLSVRLSPGADGYWHPVGAAFQDLPAQEGSVVIRSQPFRFGPQTEKPRTLHGDYGIERYYVAEGKGKALEEARNNHQVSVMVRVASDGSARIASLDVANTAP